MSNHTLPTDYVLPDFTDRLIALRASSDADISEITGLAGQLSKGRDFVMVIGDAKYIEKALIPAYINATIREREGSMHSKLLSLEIMLFLAGTMHIENAMKSVAATSSNKFIIFSNSNKLVRMLKARFSIVSKEIALHLDMSKSTGITMAAIRDGK